MPSSDRPVGSSLSATVRADLRAYADYQLTHGSREVTMRALAFRIGGGMSPSTVQRFLAGRSISSDHLDAIAEFLADQRFL